MAPRLDVDTDVAIVGAGPAGLAVATFAARAGLGAVVCERSTGPPDKACGEGLMPAGLRVLTALGAREILGPEDWFPIEGIRYVEEDGATITGNLPAGGGLGIRRTALSAALARTAEGSGVEIRWGTTVTGLERREDTVRLQTSAGVLEGRILVAADGLHSPLRKIAGLDGPAEPRERFGLRQHFRLPPWSRFVEVHLSPGVEGREAAEQEFEGDRPRHFGSLPEKGHADTRRAGRGQRVEALRGPASSLYGDTPGSS